jgi:hypothetical protein
MAITSGRDVLCFVYGRGQRDILANFICRDEGVWKERR